MKKIFKRIYDFLNDQELIVNMTLIVLVILLIFAFIYGVVTEIKENKNSDPEPTTVQQVEVTTTKVKTTEPEPEPEEPPVQYYDIPLNKDLQEYIFGLCANYEIEPELIFAIIKKESGFISSRIGDNGNSYGLMQIQPRWHQARMDSLFCPNSLNPYQNVTVGIDYLAELFDTGNSLEWVLMAYNSGPSNAYKNVASGRVSQYAKTVLLYYKNFKVGV